MSERIVTADVYIPLTQGKVAVIDFEDFEKVRGIKWYAKIQRQTAYAKRNLTKKGKRIAEHLHQVLKGELTGFEIGHKDGNGLNCRQNNLHHVTHAQNMQGKRSKHREASSHFRGVWLNKARDRWGAGIFVAGKQLHLGRFDNEIDAARAYDAAAIKYFGEHAAPNFPIQKESQCLINAGGAA